MYNLILNILHYGIESVKTAWNEMKLCIQESVSKEDVEELRNAFAEITKRRKMQ